jgi:hypothetical protein
MEIQSFLLNTCLYDCADAQDPDSILFSASGDACNYRSGGNIAGMLMLN